MKIEKDIITLGNQYKLENGTIINRYSHIVEGAEIGSNCMIGEHCYIASTAIIGNRTRIQNLVNIWDGVVIGEDVFVGPMVCFTNHHNPSDRFNRQLDFVPMKTIIKNKATLCAGCTIVVARDKDRIIGENAFIAAASTLLRDLFDNEKGYGIIK